MAQKDLSIDDVKRPDRVTPSTTSRPILISNGPTLTTDPMMTPPEEEKREADPDDQLTHTAKTIEPVSTLLKPDDREVTTETAAGESGTKVSADVPEHEEKPVKEAVSPAIPGETAIAASQDTSPASDINRDSDAAVSAEEAAEAEAKAKREQEVEDIIASEKYTVPIDAVQRKRSRMATICLFVVAIVLAVALLDTIADVGIIKVPASIPHTHFFSK